MSNNLVQFFKNEHTISNETLDMNVTCTLRDLFTLMVSRIETDNEIVELLKLDCDSSLHEVQNEIEDLFITYLKFDLSMSNKEIMTRFERFQFTSDYIDELMSNLE